MERNVRSYVVWSLVPRVPYAGCRPGDRCLDTNREVHQIRRSIRVLFMNEDDPKEENGIDGPHRPSFTLVAKIDAPTWPTLGQKKVEFRQALVPKYKVQRIVGTNGTTGCGRTWFVRAIRAIAIVVVQGRPGDGAGSIEAEPNVGRRGDVFWMQRGMDAFDLWTGGRLDRDRDGEGEQEG